MKWFWFDFKSNYQWFWLKMIANYKIILWWEFSIISEKSSANSYKCSNFFYFSWSQILFECSEKYNEKMIIWANLSDYCQTYKMAFVNIMIEMDCNQFFHDFDFDLKSFFMKWFWLDSNHILGIDFDLILNHI